jgi:oxygen-independent coproporphyrinogen-3 oxidase
MTSYLPDYAAAAVPRYTSYPTALNFTDIDGETYGRWLRGIDDCEPMSVYLHVPFCRELCWYCGCATEVNRRPERVEAYARALGLEIDLVARAADGAPEIGHLHFGGGTPTQLAPNDFLRLVGLLDRSFRFAPDAEIAVEVDPRTLDSAMVEAFAAAGVNRVSLGVQDIDPDIQQAIHRIQPLETVLDAVDLLRAAGIGRISMDMIYGLPGQTERHVRATARAIAGAGAGRVSVFGYAHVPWFRKHQKAIDEAKLPDGPARFDQMLAAADELQSAGYLNIGFDHFASPTDGLALAASSGRLRRNFQGYTDDQSTTLLGFGASAIGNLPGGYAQNAAATNDWMKRVEEGALPVVRGCAITAEDRLRRALIEEVMCTGGVDAAAICSDHGAEAGAVADAFWRLERLRLDGLVILDRERLQVRATPLGRLYLRNIAACFDPAGKPVSGRHSRSI